MPNQFAREIDSIFIRYFGLPYLLVTRDWMIHERMRFLLDWVSRELRPIRVLDAGCGSGLALLYLNWYRRNNTCFYLGLDLDTAKLTSRYSFIDIPHVFENVDLDSSWQFGLFDLVFCSEVIEHLFADERLFARLCSHLSENGVLLITTPHKEFVRRNAEQFPGFDAIRPTQDGGHVRMGYEPSELAEMAYANGFAPVGTTWLGEISCKELHGRETKRNQGDYPNMTRYNWRWFRRMNSPERPQPDRCWTLAMAFRRTSAESRSIFSATA
jgi:SAM-dependent methyltransferase